MAVQSVSCSTFANAASITPPTTSKRVGFCYTASPYFIVRRYFAGIALARRAKARSAQIDAQISRQSVSLQRECKILVLGTEGSGKSTIVRQMRLHEPESVSLDERLGMRSAVLAHLLTSALAVLDELERLNLELADSDSRDNADIVRGYVLDAADKDITEVVRAIDAIWHDSVVATRSGQFRLVDNANYFLDAAGRIGAGDYVPTDQDMLKARAPFGTVSKTQLPLGSVSIRLFEVRMQKSSKNKWMQAVDDITSIVFCASLADYDAEALGPTHRALDESLVLFENVVNSRWFQHTSVILALTKLDIFRAKLATVPLEKYAFDYKDGADAGKASKYILRQYMARNHAHLRVYPIIVEATDPAATVCNRTILTAVKDTILQSVLRTSNILP